MRLLALPLLAACAIACASDGPALRQGQTAPDFTLPDHEGNPVSLKQSLEQGPVILAFFPKAFTPGCTKQMESFRDRYADLAGKKAQVFGVSTDDPATLKKFRAELNAPFPMLSDEDGKVSAQYGGTTLGMANRLNVVIGQDGKIVQVTAGSDATSASGDVNACPVGGGA